MRTALFLFSVLLVAPACEIPGPACDCGEFRPENFSRKPAARSSLEAVTSTCERYCTAELECHEDSDFDGCVADCVEPRLLAPGPAASSVPPRDCTPEHETAQACAAKTTCEDLSTCEEAVGTYVDCTLSAG